MSIKSLVRESLASDIDFLDAATANALGDETLPTDLPDPKKKPLNEEL